MPKHLDRRRETGDVRQEARVRRHKMRDRQMT